MPEGHFLYTDGISFTMMRPVATFLIALTVGPCTRSEQPQRVLDMCELSRDYSAYSGELITVRAVYYYGLRDACPDKCADGPWPSFMNLTGSGVKAPPESLATRLDGAFYHDDLEKVVRSVETEAKKGKRFEIWVTVVGYLEATRRLSKLGPCDRIGSRYTGYGHLGAYPAQLVLHHFQKIEVKDNPASPYDYANLHRGPA